MKHLIITSERMILNRKKMTIGFTEMWMRVTCVEYFQFLKFIFLCGYKMNVDTLVDEFKKEYNTAEIANKCRNAISFNENT